MTTKHSGESMWSRRQVGVTSSAFVTNLVRNGDYEGYLASLLLPGTPLKKTALTVRAINLELSQILDLTRNTVAAQGRFLFWNDMIERAYKSDKDGLSQTHPVVAELSTCLRLHNLSKRHFEKLVKTRASLVNRHDLPFDTLEDIFKYSDGSILPVYSLIVEAFLCKNAKTLIDLDHASSHISRVQGVVNILRGLGHNAKHGRCYLPTQLLSKHGVSQQDVLRFSTSQKLSDSIYEMACIAKQESDVAKAITQQKSLKPYVSLFLPLVFSDWYLLKLEKQNFNIWSQELYQRTQNLPLKLWYEYVKMRYWI